MARTQHDTVGTAREHREMAAELLTAAASPAMECQHEAVMRLAARAGSHAQLAAAISAEEAANWLSATYNRL